MASTSLTLRVLNNTLAIYRLSSNDKLPESIFSSLSSETSFFSITKTKDEISVIVDEDIFKNQKENFPHLKSEVGFKALQVEGVLDFSLIGILANLSSILAAAGVSIFAVSTFDTDYILVREQNLEKAIKALESNSHKIIFNSK